MLRPALLIEPHSHLTLMLTSSRVTSECACCSVWTLCFVSTDKPSFMLVANKHSQHQQPLFRCNSVFLVGRQPSYQHGWCHHGHCPQPLAARCNTCFISSLPSLVVTSSSCTVSCHVSSCFDFQNPARTVILGCSGTMTYMAYLLVAVFWGKSYIRSTRKREIKDSGEHTVKDSD